MVEQPADRVTVWQSQLAANDFPPVCAMCGAPAETWRKFNFSTAPPWAFWVGGVLLATAMARRAGGYLPMTNACVKKLTVARWSFLGLIALSILFWIVAAVALSYQRGNAAIVGYAIFIGIFILTIGVIGLIVVRTAYGPSGKVMEPPYGQYEPVIELRRVHPNFVNAVRQIQAARAGQYSTPGPQTAFRPGSR